MAIKRSFKSSQPCHLPRKVPQAGLPTPGTMRVSSHKSHWRTPFPTHSCSQILTIGKNRIIFSTGLSAISRTKYLQWEQLLWVHSNAYSWLSPATTLQPAGGSQRYPRGFTLQSELQNYSEQTDFWAVLTRKQVRNLLQHPQTKITPGGGEEIHKCCAISDTAVFESNILCTHILTISTWVQASILFWDSLCSFFRGRHFLIKLPQVFYRQQRLRRTNNLITQDSHWTLTDTFHLGICLCLEFSMMKKLHGLDLRV